MFLAKLNQAGAITVLDFLDTTQAGQLCAKLMEEVSHIPCLKEGSTFKIYHNITGKPYGPEFKVIHGKATALGKPFITKPQFLIGKKGRQYSHYLQPSICD